VSSDAARYLAGKIVHDLFTNGIGDRASRLVLELSNEKRDGGGWSEYAASIRIEQIIDAALRDGIILSGPKF